MAKQTRKSKVYMAYERGRLLYMLRFQPAVAAVIGTALIFSKGESGQHLIAGLLLAWAAIGLWWGRDWGKGIIHGLILGSFGLLMPLLMPLFSLWPQLPHTLGCLLVGSLASLALGSRLLQTEPLQPLSVFYLSSSFVTILLTSSLSCLSMGVGSLLGFALGLTLLPWARFILRLV